MIDQSTGAILMAIIGLIMVWVFWDFRVAWHNLTTRFTICPDPWVRCPHCETVQSENTRYDYQKCGHCHEYIYDYRGGI